MINANEAKINKQFTDCDFSLDIEQFNHFTILISFCIILIQFKSFPFLSHSHSALIFVIKVNLMIYLCDQPTIPVDCCQGF